VLNVGSPFRLVNSQLLADYKQPDHCPFLLMIVVSRPCHVVVDHRDPRLILASGNALPLALSGTVAVWADTRCPVTVCQPMEMPMIEQWQHQLRVYLTDDLADVARSDRNNPALRP
jgi:hypothetical protein